ncbi:MAG: hypothetical protein ACLSG4_15420 [Anaerobutyricum sp.]
METDIWFLHTFHRMRGGESIPAADYGLPLFFFFSPKIQHIKNDKKTNKDRRQKNE